jgi:hypothetical protein
MITTEIMAMFCGRDEELYQVAIPLAYIEK